MGATAALFAAVAAAAATAAEPSDPDRYVGWPLLLRLEVEFPHLNIPLVQLHLSFDPDRCVGLPLLLSADITMCAVCRNLRALARHWLLVTKSIPLNLPQHGRGFMDPDPEAPYSCNRRTWWASSGGLTRRRLWTCCTCRYGAILNRRCQDS